MYVYPAVYDFVLTLQTITTCCTAGMCCHKVKPCVAFRATCMTIQYVIYGMPPSSPRFPSISVVIIPLSNISPVCAAWFDAHILFTFHQILNRKLQATEWPWRLIQEQFHCCHFEDNKERERTNFLSAQPYKGHSLEAMTSCVVTNGCQVCQRYF